jgi:geranylgeranylglycerol-phosphate geranylgeranyltransferase
MKARDAWMLARGGNALMAGLGAVAGGVVSAAPVPWLRLAFAFLACAFVAAFGNTLNDLADLELDRVAHPERPLPSRRATPKQAQNVLVAFGSAGLVFAVLAGGYPLALYAAATMALLHQYETRLKAKGVVGNLVVALLVAATFPFGALAAAAPVESWLPVVTLAGLALLVNLGRELLKGIEDADADRGHRRTVALTAGPRLAAGAALFAVLGACVFASLRVRHPSPGWWAGFPWLLGASLVVLAAGGLVGLRSAPRGQRVLKLGMLVALLAFLAGPLVPLLVR